jgi:hypothetical protein
MKRRTQQKQETCCCFCLDEMRNPVKMCDAGHYSCVDCYEEFTEMVDWDRVMHAPEESFVARYVNKRCPVCRRLTSAKPPDSLALAFLPRKLFTDRCSICEAVFADYHSLVKHNLLCGQRRKECRFCEEEFPLYLLTEHVRLDCVKMKCVRCIKPPDMDMTQYKDHMKMHDRWTSFGFPNNGIDFEVFNSVSAGIIDTP